MNLFSGGDQRLLDKEKCPAPIPDGKYSWMPDHCIQAELPQHIASMAEGSC